MMHVLVAPGTLVAGVTISLSADESHHLQVRRASEDIEVIALDTIGNSAIGRLLRDGKEWLFAADGVTHRERAGRTTLAVAAGDRDRFQMLVEKAAELDVASIIPLETERSRQVSSRFRDTGLEKMRRQAAEACKQCGNAWMPVVEEPIAFDAFVASAPAVRWFLGDVDGGACPEVGTRESIGWLVGPEGGFSPQEIHALHAQLSPERVRLSDHVLRFETAAIAAAALTWDRRQHA